MPITTLRNIHTGQEAKILAYTEIELDGPTLTAAVTVQDEGRIKTDVMLLATSTAMEIVAGLTGTEGIWELSERIREARESRNGLASFGSKAA